MVPGIILAAFLTLAAVWSVLRLEPLHPAQLWTIPWALATDLYVLRLLPYRNLSWRTALLAICATTAFAGSTLLAERWITKHARDRDFKPSTLAPVERAAAICLSLTLVLLIAFLVQAVSRYGLHDAVLSPAPLRAGIAQARFTLTVKYVYFDLAACALSGIAAAVSTIRRRRLMWIVIAAGCVACTYFATGRATIVDAAIVAAVAYALAGGIAISRRRFVAGLAGLLALTLVVFLVGGSIIGKTYSNNPDFEHIPNFFRSHSALSDLALPYEYASAPIAALNVQVASATTWGDGHGCAALHPICVGLRTLGADVPSVATVRPFTAAPLPWNTYTALDVPLIDGGTAVVVPLVALLGLLIGAIWGLAQRHTLGWTVVYAIESVALVTSAGSFNFTATFLLGSSAIALVAGLAAARLINVQMPYARVRGPQVRRGAAPDA